VTRLIAKHVSELGLLNAMVQEEQTLVGRSLMIKYFVSSTLEGEGLKFALKLLGLAFKFFINDESQLEHFFDMHTLLESYALGARCSA